MYYTYILSIRILRVIMINIRRVLMKGKDLVKLLKESGWHVARIRGSHHVMKKGNNTEIIPVHNTNIPLGLLNAILKWTGLK